MADVPANAHPCQSCPRPIWDKANQCGFCQPNQEVKDESADVDP